MNGVRSRHGERRDRSERRVSGRRGGDDRRAPERRQRFTLVAVDRRNSTDRRTGDRRLRKGRRIVGDRREVPLT